MAKYLQRSCPKCNGYLGIMVPERKAKMPVQAINGRCLKCGYRLAWVLVLGKRLANLLRLIFFLSLFFSRSQPASITTEI